VPTSVVDEVLQNVGIILNTSVGSVPGYREFGLNMEYLHAPVNVAETMFVLALNTALRQFEPRAFLNKVKFVEDINKAGKVSVDLEVEINE